MKHWMVIGLTIVLVACAERRPEMVVTADEASPTEELNNDGVVSLKDAGTELDLMQALIGDKLENLGELITLKQEHPEFSEAISEELNEYASITENLPNGVRNIQIEIVEWIGTVEAISENHLRQKVSFEWVGDNYRKKDTLAASIFIKEVELEGNKVLSYEVEFQK